MKKENKNSNEIKIKDFRYSDHSFRIRNANKHITRMQEIISSYGIPNNQKLSDNNKSSNILRIIFMKFF